MTRRGKVLLMIACVVLGAAINVLVAWGCSIWSRSTQPPLELDPVSTAGLWNRHAKTAWPSHAKKVKNGTEEISFGRTLRTASAYVVVSSSEPRKQSPPFGAMSHSQVEEDYLVLEYAAGFPLESLQASAASFGPTQDSDFDGTWALPEIPGLRSHAGEHLPIRPIWRGFFLDTIFYAAILWMLIRGPWETRRRWREWRRRCGWCGYPFGEAAVCTECGKPKPARAAGEASTSSARG